MKLTVAIPVYNAEKYFPATMESVLNQTYKDFEILLINDGSTDNSGKLCNEYAQKYNFIRVIHQKNMGLSHGRNVSIKECKTEFLSMIDADDILHPDYYKRMVSVLESTGMPVVKCNRYYLDKGEKPIFKPISDKEADIISAKKTIENDIIKLRRPFLVEGMCTKLYRTEVLKDLTFDETLRNEEDFLFVAELLFKIKEFAKIEDVLYFVVDNENSVTNNPAYMTRNINSIVDSKIAFIKKLEEMNFAKINTVISNSLFGVFDEFAFWKDKRHCEVSPEVKEKIIKDFSPYENRINSSMIKIQFNALKKEKYNVISFFQRKTLKSIYKRTRK